MHLLLECEGYEDLRGKYRIKWRCSQQDDEKKLAHIMEKEERQLVNLWQEILIREEKLECIKGM